MVGIFLKALNWARQRLNLVTYLTAENLVLRQQLLVLKRGQRRPQIKKKDRLFWVATSIKKLIQLPRVGGLHHRYEWSQVA